LVIAGIEEKDSQRRYNHPQGKQAWLLEPNTT
jgi:hypothetical protein